MSVNARLAALALATTVLSAVTGGAHAGTHWSAQARSLMSGVPCKAPEITETATSSNLKQFAQVPLSPTLEGSEIDVNKGLLVSAFFSDPGGFVVADVSHPMKARILSTFHLDGLSSFDVKTTADGTTALVGTTGDEVNGAGIALVDIRDPAQPKLMDRWISGRPGANQHAHMLYTANIDGTDWVFMAANDSTGVWILKLVGPPGGRKLEFVTQSLLGEGGPLGPHDMYVQFDRTLETWVLYAADAFEGWLAYDVGDPTKPTFIGGFLHPSSGYTHTIQAGVISGRRIVATVEEVGVNLLKIYDATDLSKPVLLGVWHTGGGNGPVESQHNLQIVKNRLYVAHYEQGIYVFDLSKVAKDAKPLTSELKPMAHYLPEGTTFWDVVIEDGLLYTSRFRPGGGFDVVGFGCLRPGDKSATSTG